MKSHNVTTAPRDAEKATEAGSHVDATISRFPGPVALPVSRGRWLGLLGSSLAFGALSMYIAHDGTTSSGGAFKPSVSLVFFGICGIVAAVMLLPGAGGLTLGAEGFETTTLFRKFWTPWQRVSNFAVVEVSVPRHRRKRFVGYNDAKYPTGNLNRRTTGYNAALSDTYGFSHDELARLLNRWRALALAPPHQHRP
jgi:hypothetical protein